MRSSGMSYLSIAKHFKVTHSTVYQWCMGDEERRLYQKKWRERTAKTKYSKERINEMSRKVQEKRKTLHPLELKEYYKERYAKENKK